MVNLGNNGADGTSAPWRRPLAELHGLGLIVPVPLSRLFVLARPSDSSSRRP
ncbi:MAG: hypothetical protein WCH37_02255 [Synechococcaceae cyanobacterium ELA182]